jgi:hypothetical protein
MAQTQQLMSTEDQLAFQQLVIRILSDAAFKAQFASDPDQALNHLDVQFSAAGRAAVIANHQQATNLVSSMDVTAGAFFFYSKA